MNPPITQPCAQRHRFREEVWTAVRVEAGEPVVVNTGDARLFYQKLDGTDQIIGVRQAVEPQPDPVTYNLLLLSFYLAIALVIFLWIWPLSRDLNKLEKQTKLLGSEIVPDELRIAPTSAVYDLASDFNRMSRRVRDLLASHKEMTYAVSHELRTPLARMKFGLEMANDMQDVQKVKQQLAGVREDVTEMDALVNQLFAYAGFENSDQKLDFQSGDMGALIHQLILRVQSNPTHAQLSFEFKSELNDDAVICEWYLMERAILNLLHNAQRYAKHTISITLRKSAEHFQVIVDDDGPGIPEPERQRIFQSFIRLTDHTNAQTRGLGLGLAIVSKIMQWHGGRAFADASPSGGARRLVQQREGGGRIRREGRPDVAGAAHELVVGLVDLEDDLVAAPGAVEKNVHATHDPGGSRQLACRECTGPHDDSAIRANGDDGVA